MKLKYEFAVCEIADSRLAVVVGEGIDSFHSLIRMNDTGALIFEKLKNDISEDTLIEQMSEAYPGESYETVTAVVREFVGKLADAGLIESSD